MSSFPIGKLNLHPLPPDDANILFLDHDVIVSKNNCQTGDN